MGLLLRCNTIVYCLLMRHDEGLPPRPKDTIFWVFVMMGEGDN